MARHIIRPLITADAPAWRALRLEMLERDPQGFTADLEQAQRWSDQEWRDLIPVEPDAIFGLFLDGALAGSSGFYAERDAKLAHKGTMWGVYVRAELRGRGFASALVAATIAHARNHVDVLLTGASAAGAPVYRRAGFETYGIERDAYRVAGVPYDDELMALRLTRP